MMAMIFVCMATAHFTFSVQLLNTRRAFAMTQHPTPVMYSVAMWMAILLNAVCLGYAIVNVGVQLLLAIRY